MWIGFPSDAELWEDDLVPAQFEVAAFAEAIHADGAGEEVWLVAADDAAAAKARALAPVRDASSSSRSATSGCATPARSSSAAARTAARRASASTAGATNMTSQGDDSIGERLAAAAGLPYAKADWVLEGGAIDGDGTRQCS